MLFSRVYVMKFVVYQECFMLLPVLHGTITQITPDIPQTSLHKHRIITQITPDTPQTSFHKHGTIT
jgi:hypothetical protein